MAPIGLIGIVPNGMGVAKVGDDKVVEDRIVRNTLSLMEQIGAA